MMLVPPTIGELSSFSGRSSVTFSEYADEALAQATLLFYLATDLEEYPENPQLLRLAKNGILSMADKIYLSQPYQEASASPFQSETIGSYSYSRITAAVKKGDATGVMWFDLAVNKLKGGGSGIGDSGSIQGMEWDGLAVGPDGRAKIIGAGGSHQPVSGWAWDIDTNPEIIHNHTIL
jgi:hypothetical protein